MLPALRRPAVRLAAYAVIYMLVVILLWPDTLVPTDAAATDDDTGLLNAVERTAAVLGALVLVGAPALVTEAALWMRRRRTIGRSAA